MPDYLTTILIVVGALALIWILINLKRSRSDGTLVKKIHPYRTLMAYIMPKRNESIVFFDLNIHAEKLLEYVERARRAFDANLTHCLVGAVAIALAENPKMNQFVVGRRMYRRRGMYATFSMKRKKLDQESKLAVVKQELRPGESFRDLCGRINQKISFERTDKKTHADKEYGLFTKVPRAILVRAVPFMMWLDYHNLLPAGFIRDDGLYTSVFVANLGSLQMDAGYHHLYEWGNCPLFLMVGKVEDRPVVVDGQLKIQKTLPIRLSFDERIDDGLTARAGIESLTRVLENPFEHLGCLDDSEKQTEQA